MTLELPESGDCVFCAIVAGNTGARWEVHPDASTPDATVACFHNQLKWARVMLLIVPTRHMTQKEFWSSHVLVDAASLAVKMGDKHCKDEGYRVISNFGRVAHQSQAHAHIHVVSGTSHQIREARRTSRNSVPSGPLDFAGGDSGSGDIAGGDSGSGDLVIAEYVVDEVPFAAEISLSVSSSALSVTQREFWNSEQILHASQAAQRIGGHYSPEGFRLISSFDPASDDASDNRPGQNLSGLFLLGGGQLGLYV
ncbi:MAG: HIT domain-containing protein [Chloroflexi bacterium]|nr:HIT domain-containing protein [Chloroflexota bacterium]